MSESWQELNKPRQPAPQSAQTDDFLSLNARLFNSADGRKWLEHQREMKFERNVPVEISQSALVHLEGQRQFLRDIKRDIALWNERVAAKQEKK